MLDCISCEQYIKTFRTSKFTTEKPSSKSKMIDINLRSVVATTSAGSGLTSLTRVCTNLNVPEPITENRYNRYIRYIEEKAVTNCERSLSDAAQELRKMKLNGRKDGGQVIDVAFSVDGAWQKRYGFNSLNGMVFLISIDTGCVLHYVVRSKFCHECRANPNKSLVLKEKHKETCCVNHDGSSGSMEKECRLGAVVPAGSVGRDLNLQKLNYQYLTTSVAVVLVVR